MVNRSDLQHVLIASAVLLGLFALASRRLPVRLGMDADVTPDDFLARSAAMGDGQSLVLQHAYRPQAGREAEFRQAMAELRESRLRNGALRWRLQPDAQQPGIWHESFELASAAEWRRFPTRMTQADRVAHESVQATLEADASDTNIPPVGGNGRVSESR